MPSYWWPFTEGFITGRGLTRNFQSSFAHHLCHDDVIKWKYFQRNWPFVWGIHRSPVNSPQKGQWRRALMFSLICARTNGWINNREAGDLIRHRAHYDVTVMYSNLVIQRWVHLTARESVATGPFNQVTSKRGHFKIYALSWLEKTHLCINKITCIKHPFVYSFIHSCIHLSNYFCGISLDTRIISGIACFLETTLSLWIDWGHDSFSKAALGNYNP